MSSFPVAIGREHHAFRKWSIDRGVQINGIEAGVMPGQGMGIYATRDIEVVPVILYRDIRARYCCD